MTTGSVHSPGDFDRRDWDQSLRGPFLKSVVVHSAMAAIVIGWGWWQGSSPNFGDLNAGGAVVGVEVVRSIPLPSKGRQNPLANDTESIAPQAKEEPKPKPADAPKPAPKATEKQKAVDLNLPKQTKAKEDKQTKAPEPVQKQKFRSFDELDPNQLTSRSAPQTSDPMFSAQSGSGRIGTGMNTTLGTQFAAYSAQIRELVARSWKTGDVDPTIRKGPTVIAAFEISRDGRARNIRLIQKSGIISLDASVQRAINDASPFPPLPDAFPDRTASVEFNFELQR